MYFNLRIEHVDSKIFIIRLTIVAIHKIVCSGETKIAFQISNGHTIFIFGFYLNNSFSFVLLAFLTVPNNLGFMGDFCFGLSYLHVNSIKSYKKYYGLTESIAISLSS